jgi:translation initiation factor IF-1
VEALPSTMFGVQIDGGHAVLATISAYDLARGRITHRHR